MGHTPYGYRIENGCAVINEDEAAKIRNLYENYLAGMAQSKAAIEAGIEAYHSSAKRLMQNRHYLGDDFYPAIIDVDTFTEAMLERQRRMKALGRTDRSKPAVLKTAPTNFHFGEVAAYYDDPVSQAEYLYRLIESEER